MYQWRIFLERYNSYVSHIAPFEVNWGDDKATQHQGNSSTVRKCWMWHWKLLLQQESKFKHKTWFVITMTNKSSQTFSHWIFGYGSLICPKSRAVTAPSLQGRRATPVVVHHLERIWSLPVPQVGQTFMGIRRQPHAQAVGVLVPVSDEELDQFDIREQQFCKRSQIKAAGHLSCGFF